MPLSCSWDFISVDSVLKNGGESAVRKGTCTVFGSTSPLSGRLDRLRNLLGGSTFVCSVIDRRDSISIGVAGLYGEIAEADAEDWGSIQAFKRYGWGVASVDVVPGNAPV